jgi:PIN domain nuclease of toxin-antitoxin system
VTSLLVLDTHPLLWYAAGAEKKLGPAGRKAFRAYERGEGAFYVPAPVVIETWFLSMNGTIAVEGSIGGWWQRIASPTLHHVDLSHDDVLEAARLDWDHQDPFDRMIVATARRLDCPLLTKDATIRAFKGVETVW